PFSEMIGPKAPTPVCIAYGPMWHESFQDNICKKHNYFVPNIPIPTVIAPFLPTAIVFKTVALQSQQNLITHCERYAAFNWWFASTAYVAYDMEQAARKQIIHALAADLARPID